MRNSANPKWGTERKPHQYTSYTIAKQRFSKTFEIIKIAREKRLYIQGNSDENNTFDVLREKDILSTQILYSLKTSFTNEGEMKTF